MVWRWIQHLLWSTLFVCVCVLVRCNTLLCVVFSFYACHISPSHLIATAVIQWISFSVRISIVRQRNLWQSTFQHWNKNRHLQTINDACSDAPNDHALFCACDERCTLRDWWLLQSGPWPVTFTRWRCLMSYVAKQYRSMALIFLCKTTLFSLKNNCAVRWLFYTSRSRFFLHVRTLWSDIWPFTQFPFSVRRVFRSCARHFQCLVRISALLPDSAAGEGPNRISWNDSNSN